jgi:spermidine synthase
VLLLFSVPTILLGMVSPFAVRLTVRQVGTTGSSAGSLYALSTIGSILGAFLPVLVLTPAWGVRRTILALALVLLLASLWGLRLRAHRFGALPALILLAVLAILIPLLQPFVQPGQPDILGPLRPVPNLIYEHESMYNYIQVVRTPDGCTALMLNEGASINVVHSIYDPQRIVQACNFRSGWYSDYILTVPYFNAGFQPDQVHSLAVVGLAGGTIVRQYDAVYHPTRIDGAEIDPDIVAVARKYFALNEPSLHVYFGDGRTFIRATNQTYDVLAVDAYQQPYMPFQLTTVEFYQEVLAHLSPRGIVAVNSGHCGNDFQLVDALVNTLYKAGFASVYTFDVPGALNTVIVATRIPTSVDTFRQSLAQIAPDALIAPAAAAAASAVTAAPAQPGGLYFTDDHAPVEQITDSLVLNCATGRGA